eukprot:6614497-Pyramimonas_sp.AAC.1
MPPDLAGFSCAGVRGVSEAECGALVALFRGFNGETWVDKHGWLATKDVCYWTGIRCNRKGVGAIVIKWSSLTGTYDWIPEARVTAALAAVDWCALPHLQQLELDFNVACTVIHSCVMLPPALMNLAGLKHFFFGHNFCAPNAAFASWYEALRGNMSDGNPPTLCAAEVATPAACAVVATPVYHRNCSACRRHVRSLDNAFSKFQNYEQTCAGRAAPVTQALTPDPPACAAQLAACDAECARIGQTVSGYCCDNFPRSAVDHPSCWMGCRMADVETTVEACVARCAEAEAAGCHYTCVTNRPR